MGNHKHHNIAPLVDGEVAVAKVAHAEHLKSSLPSDLVETELRSSAALTTALLGMSAEEALVVQWLNSSLERSQQAR